MRLVCFECGGGLFSWCLDEGFIMSYFWCLGELVGIMICNGVICLVVGVWKRVLGLGDCCFLGFCRLFERRFLVVYSFVRSLFLGLVGGFVVF